MKAVVSNRIYMTVTPEYREALERELTYTIPSFNPNDPPEVIKNISRIRTDLVSIPSGRMDLIPEGYEFVDKRVTQPADFPEFRFKLRESQQDVYDDVEDCGIINASVSWGKTFSALAIAAKLGQKTLVVTHTTRLRKQWEEEVEKVFGIKPAVIGGGKFETHGPIVVGNIQTLTKHIPKLSKMFGTIILDEMHHVSAPTFGKLIDTSHARYKLGLSGTIERKDGKHIVFRDYFGQKLWQPPKENYMPPEVEVIHTDIRFTDSKQPWALRVNKLVEQQEYVHLVAMIGAAYAARGHSVLIVSDRVEFLHDVAYLIGDIAVAVTGKIKSEDERDRLIELVRSGEKKVLCGTQAMFAEGISINILSCLVLGTPLNNNPLLTQLIGRIVRTHDGKPTPIVADIFLKGKTVKNQASQRMGHYIKEGYTIREIRGYEK